MSDAESLRHPPGLYVCFFTEMWERFSFYCMRTLLVLYMVEALGFGTEKGSTTYGWYLGLVYATGGVGGWLADRYLGYVRSILIGGVLMAFGYGLLTVEKLPFFYGALGLVVLGNGLFKPNVSTLVGNLYHDRPQLKDSAYNIFYMGINIGACVSPLVAEALRNTYGWAWAFGACAVGMVISVAILATFHKLVSSNVQLSSEEQAAEESIPKHVERDRIITLIIVFVIVILFWMAYEQAGNTLTLWARDSTDTSWLVGLLGHSPLLSRWLIKDGNLTPGIYQFFNPFFILVFTPLAVMMWRWLAVRGKEPSTPTKIALGMLLTAVSFAVMTVAGRVGGDAGRVGWSWLIWSYAVSSAAEICLSPMGLSLTNKLAPRRLRGFFMGGWFVSTAIGDKLSGDVGAYYDRIPHSVFYGILVASSLFAFGLLWLALPRLRRTMHGIA